MEFPVFSAALWELCSEEHKPVHNTYAVFPLQGFGKPVKQGVLKGRLAEMHTVSGSPDDGAFKRKINKGLAEG